MAQARPKVYLKFRGGAADQLFDLAEYFKSDLESLDLKATPEDVVRLGIMHLQTIKENAKDEETESPKDKAK